MFFIYILTDYILFHNIIHSHQNPSIILTANVGASDDPIQFFLMISQIQGILKETTNLKKNSLGQLFATLPRDNKMIPKTTFFYTLLKKLRDTDSFDTFFGNLSSIFIQNTFVFEQN